MSFDHARLSKTEGFPSRRSAGALGGADVVRKVVNHRGVFERLWARVTQGKPGLKKAMPYPAVPASAVLVAAEPPADESVLVVDLKANRVTSRGHEIPTRPNNLQRQPLLALAVLASRAGEVVTAELAEGMHRLGGLRKRPVAPEAKDLRYKISRPFKRALGGVVPLAELDAIVETVKGVGVTLRTRAMAIAGYATTGERA